MKKKFRHSYSGYYWGVPVVEDLHLVIDRYACNNRLCISTYSKEGPFAHLTVNLPDVDLPPFETEGKEYAFLDVNNFPQAEEFCIRHLLAVPTGITAESGFCIYPLYQFDMKALEE